VADVAPDLTFIVVIGVADSDIETAGQAIDFHVSSPVIIQSEKGIHSPPPPLKGRRFKNFFHALSKIFRHSDDALSFAIAAVKHPVIPRAPAPGTHGGVGAHRRYAYAVAGHTPQVAAGAARAPALETGDHRRLHLDHSGAAAYWAIAGLPILGIETASSAVTALNRIHKLQAPGPAAFHLG
jgi:hypothetical protein